MFFEKVIERNQNAINSLINEKIIQILFTDYLSAWEVEIKKDNVFHAPNGHLVIKTAESNYVIGNYYQSLDGTSFGVEIHKIENIEPYLSETIKDFTKNLYWKNIINTPFKSITWNWYKDNALEFDDSFPDNLIFEFENGQKIYFVAAEPDEEFPHLNTYKLLRAGEEIMIFFSEEEALLWGIDLKNDSERVIKKNRS